MTESLQKNRKKKADEKKANIRKNLYFPGILEYVNDVSNRSQKVLLGFIKFL